MAHISHSVISPDPRRKTVKKSKGSGVELAFERFSKAATFATGKPAAFIIAALVIVVWGLSGPIFHFSDTWQLVINTGTTIITFLMVFLIQQSQNKDTVALHLKLNELIAAQKTASNRLINIEDLSDEELHTLKNFYIQLSELAEQDGELFTTHSVDEAKQNHVVKSTKRASRTHPGLDAVSTT
jgi:low affinity Fe/Cu permease